MLLAIPTLGLPAAVKAMTWIDDILSNCYTSLLNF
jgi:hypothetical protein